MSRFSPPGRVVVKVGSSSLRSESGDLDRELIGELVSQLVAVRQQGVQVVLVSSGAVAAGLRPLGLTSRPTDMPGLQAAASVGQSLLMQSYHASFARHGVACGQVLLTPDDVVQRARYLNARQTFERLLGLGVVPVVNENDTVATDELRFGDNDRLAALAASMLNAQLLVLLSDVDGVLAEDPGGGQPSVLERVDDLSRLATRTTEHPGSDVGRGGMASKVEAARIATFSAAHAVVANARRPEVVRDVVAGQPVGTWFPPHERRPESRKLWIAFASGPRGALVVDAGAVTALVEGGKSLLPAGITEVRGAFAAGDPVDVLGPDGRVIARGLVGYQRDDVARVRGLSTAGVAAELGPHHPHEVIHRDALVILV